MTQEEEYKIFEKITALNIKKRSRLKIAHEKARASSLPLPLLSRGSILNSDLLYNVHRVTTSIYRMAPMMRETETFLPEALHSTFNDWFDQLFRNIIDVDSYVGLAEEQSKLQSNMRFRFWNLKHKPLSPDWTDIQERMREFRIELCFRIRNLKFSTSYYNYACLLAWSDRELEYVIDPWVDGSEIFSTMAVMWLSRLFPALPAPDYTAMEKSVASTSILHLDYHTEYMMKCLEKGRKHQ